MKLDHAAITQAIQDAERNTSGEIQVVVSKKRSRDIYRDAQKVFQKIGLGQTRHHNAVLFFIAEKSHQFAVLGDEGIHAVVHQEFWGELSKILSVNFKKNEFTLGLCEAIAMCGLRLKMHYPHHDQDVNELQDEVHVSV